MHWYFDFISPFAYLQSTRLKDILPPSEVEYVPVLFAGILNHWGQKGPAELSTKRRWTFEHCAWLAHRDNIELKFPAEHPFNPLPLLRLCIAAGNTAEAVDRIFRYVWVEGHLPADTAAYQALCDEFGLSPEEINADEVKQTLRSNGDKAVAAGVFGVPTVICNERLFWGYDATDMVIASFGHGSGPDTGTDHEPDWPLEKIEAAGSVPEGLQRKQSKPG